MDRQLRQEYLQAMGIHSWSLRESPQKDAEPDTARPAAGDGSSVTETAAAVASDTSTTQGSVEHVTSATQGTGTVPREAIPDTAMQRSRPSDQTLEEAPAPWLDNVPDYDEDFVPAELDDEAYAGLEQELNGGRDDLSRLDWKGLEHRVARCEACELAKSRSNTVFGVGDRAADLLVIGEAPGAEEDRQGEPFVGRAGQLLNAMLLAIGLKREQVFIANILKCRPPNNRDPRPEEALRCEPFLRRQIELIRPRAILCVGRIAAQNLLKTDETLGRLRARSFNYGGIPVVVTYHPAYLLRSPDQKGKSWEDLQRVVQLVRARR